MQPAELLAVGEFRAGLERLLQCVANAGLVVGVHALHQRFNRQRACTQATDVPHAIIDTYVAAADVQHPRAHLRDLERQRTAVFGQAQCALGLHAPRDVNERNHDAPGCAVRRRFGERIDQGPYRLGALVVDDSREIAVERLPSAGHDRDRVLLHGHRLAVFTDEVPMGIGGHASLQLVGAEAEEATGHRVAERNGPGRVVNHNRRERAVEDEPVRSVGSAARILGECALDRRARAFCRVFHQGGVGLGPPPHVARADIDECDPRTVAKHRNDQRGRSPQPRIEIGVGNARVGGGVLDPHGPAGSQLPLDRCPEPMGGVLLAEDRLHAVIDPTAQLYIDRVAIDKRVAGTPRFKEAPEQFAGPGGDLGRGVQAAQAIREFQLEARALLGQHPLSGVDERADDAGGAPVLAVHRTVRKVEVTLFRVAEAFDGEGKILESDRLAAHHVVPHRAHRRPDLAPHVLRGGAERLRVARAEDGHVCVVVDQQALLAPGEVHRQLAGQHDPHRGAQCGRPAVDGAERGGAPVMRPYEAMHGPGAGEIGHGRHRCWAGARRAG